MATRTRYSFLYLTRVIVRLHEPKLYAVQTERELETTRKIITVGIKNNRPTNLRTHTHKKKNAALPRTRNSDLLNQVSCNGISECSTKFAIFGGEFWICGQNWNVLVAKLYLVQKITLCRAISHYTCAIRCHLMTQHKTVLLFSLPVADWNFHCFIVLEEYGELHSFKLKMAMPHRVSFFPASCGVKKWIQTWICDSTFAPVRADH